MSQKTKLVKRYATTIRIHKWAVKGAKTKPVMSIFEPTFPSLLSTVSGAVIKGAVKSAISNLLDVMVKSAAMTSAV